MPSFSQLARKQPKKQRTRALLFDAASEILAKRGPLASVSEIADQAGVAIGTFYNHFGNRDELVQQLSQAIADVVTREMEAWLPVRGDSAHALARGLVATIMILAREPDWGWAFVQVDNPYAPPWTDRAIYTRMRDQINAGAQAGHFSVQADDFLLYFIDTSVRAALRAQLDSKGRSEAPSQCIALILRALGVANSKAEALSILAVQEVDELLRQQT